MPRNLPAQRRPGYHSQLILLSILFGGAFTLASAYALGSIALRKLPAPPEIALAVGAVLESALVFLALLGGVGYWPVYLAIGASAMAAFPWLRGKHAGEAVPWNRTAAALFAAYGLFYLVNSLAPETLADGLTYHLGLPYEYTRLGTFPRRIEFYNMLPQGMEMLFTMAFAFGRHSAARLVEFGFFLAGVPLIFRIGRRLGMSDLASLVAAVFYFTAPVIAVTGVTSYNDAALVFYTLAAFYLLLVWRGTADARYLPAAGLLAGFCYDIKFSGIFTAAGAVLFVLWVRPQKAILVVAGAALAVAPWAIRSTVLTRDPVAPLMSSVFRNPYFHVATETDLAKSLRSLNAVAPARVPWELAFGDHLMGTYGPLLFALPLGLLALRKRSARLCLMAAAILAIPWYSNTGARFLMPSLTFAALALGMALPRRWLGLPSRSRRLDACRRCWTRGCLRISSGCTNSPGGRRCGSSRKTSTSRATIATTAPLAWWKTIRRRGRASFRSSPWPAPTWRAMSRCPGFRRKATA